MRRALPLLATSLLSIPLLACGDSGGTGGGGGGSSPLTDDDIRPVVEAYAAGVRASYAESLAGVRSLRAAIDAFVAEPTAETLDDARAAWIAARPAYLETEVFRFYGGPIDDEATGPEGRINGWPLDEVYIDYVEGAPDAGIIQDVDGYPTIDEAVLAAANEVGGEKNLSAGWHAIEFLLWGQDQNDTGPGARPHTDYLPAEEGGTAPEPARRAAYLVAAASLLESDLQSVADAWAPTEGSYGAAFVTDAPRAGLTKMLQGMGSLSGGELTSERMFNAFTERDQEEEHSCFSDTTHADHLHDLIGVENVYLGRYGGADGAGVDDLVRAADASLADRLAAELAAARTAIGAIPQPFDQAIQDDAPGGGREKIQAAMDALTTLTGSISEAAAALDVTLNLDG